MQPPGDAKRKKKATNQEGQTAVCACERWYTGGWGFSGGDGCGLAGGQVIPTRSTLLYSLVSAATTRGSGVGRQPTELSVIWQVAPQVGSSGRSDVRQVWSSGGFAACQLARNLLAGQRLRV